VRRIAGTAGAPSVIYGPVVFWRPAEVQPCPFYELAMARSFCNDQVSCLHGSDDQKSHFRVVLVHFFLEQYRKVSYHNTRIQSHILLPCHLRSCTGNRLNTTGHRLKMLNSPDRKSIHASEFSTSFRAQKITD
jgi:hypothetical protein